jgi:hypothetical protein
LEIDRQSIDRDFPPVREGYDRAAVDAYVSALAAELETLARASGALHDRVRELGAELSALTVRLRAGMEELGGRGDLDGAGGDLDRARGDLDGARLVALNMALSGEPREQADRLLAESFDLADRAKLLDEVYTAVED